MAADLESSLDLVAGSHDWVADADVLRFTRKGLYEAGFATAWELQSQLATVVLIALAAFAPLALSLGVMLSWSLAATWVYFQARRRGLPDMFDARLKRPPLRARCLVAWAAGTALSVIKALAAGVQPFLYAKAVGSLLGRPANCRRTRLGRVVVLSVALVLFGVSASHHLLRRAGLPDGKAMRLCLMGSFLNVSYRVLLGALVFNTATRLTSSIAG